MSKASKESYENNPLPKNEVSHLKNSILNHRFKVLIYGHLRILAITGIVNIEMKNAV